MIVAHTFDESVVHFAALGYPSPGAELKALLSALPTSDESFDAAIQWRRAGRPDVRQWAEETGWMQVAYGETSPRSDVG